MTVTKNKLEEFTDVFLVLFDDFSRETLEHWDKWGREEHTHFESCIWFHAGNFDGFMMWLIRKREDRGEAKTIQTGKKSDGLDSAAPRQAVERN